MGLADTLTAVARTAGNAVAAFREGLEQRGPAGVVEQRAAGLTYSPALTFGAGAAATLALDAETRGFSHSAVAYRCVHAIATNGASVDLEIRGSDGEAIPGHWCSELWNKRPNDGMSAVALKYLTLSQLELGGQSFLWLDRGEEGTLAEPQAMHLLYGTVRPLVDRSARDTPAPADVMGYQATTADGTVLYLLPDEVLWLRYPHPTRPLGVLAPWRAAMHAVDMDAYAREWQSSSYRNGARPGGVIYLGDMDEQTYASTVAAFRSGVEGPRNAGKHLLLRSSLGGSDARPGYERLGLTPAEMDYLESRAANAAEVMLAFGVPHDYLVGGTTYENRSAAKATLWSDTIVPKLTFVASEIDRVLLPSPAEDAAWDLSDVDALQDSQDSVANRIRSGTYADIYTIDESRAEVGLPPLPGGIGQLTLTPYRAQFAAQAGPAAAGGERAWDAVWPARAAPSTPEQHAPAVAPAAEPRAVEGPAHPTAAEILAAYDELEAAGVREVRQLAREMQTHVLRDFDRLAKKPQRFAAWRDELHQAAVVLAREGALTLDVPDEEHTDPLCATRLEVPHWTVDDGTPEMYGVRIRVSEIFDPRRWVRRTREVLRSWVERVWRRGGTSIDPAFELNPVVTEALNARLDVLAERVTDTTRQILTARLLQAGIEQGESVEQLRARIQGVFADLANYRAERIARTEAVGAFSAAAHAGAVNRGATHKVWHSTADHRTRPTHRTADGSRAEIGARFRLTQSRYPADPTAPANQSINCRCYLTFEYNTEENES